ncbi:MAG: hypothetical protein GXP62_03065 [Oligoflexia bacterium]|nr:hypothetical protein [Oligoflexia bacterium]
MSCKSNTKTFGPILVCSSKSSSIWLFHPITGPMGSNQDVPDGRPDPGEISTPW